MFIEYQKYDDLECSIKKTDWYKNNPEKSSTKKMRKHIQCGYSMLTIWRFNHADNHRNRHSLTKKINILYILENIVGKSLMNC